jgi:hypothetical protein
MRITSLRIAAAVGGRPGRRRWVKSHLRATSRRCQASSVAEVTGNTSPHRSRGISRDSAASHSRSAAWYRTRPIWRRSTAFSCRSTKSSAPLDASRLAVTIRQPSRQRTSRYTIDKIIQR